MGRGPRGGIPMKVRNWMTPDPITVTSDTLIIDAQKIMKDHRIRRLPVVDRGKLVGIVTYRTIIEASPSAATSLSIHELNYLLLKLKVKDVMQKKPITVTPDDSVIDIILLGANKGIGSFPVVENGKLVGIVTETEIVQSMLAIFGTRVDDEIITLENVGPEESIGVFRRLAEVLEDLKVPVLAIFAMPHRRTKANRIYVRVKTKKIKPIIEELAKAGYEITD